MIEFNPTRAKWEQILQIITARIEAGELQPGDMLSEVKLTAEFGVDRKTIRKAIAHLRTTGLVITRPGMGSFVTDRPGTETD
ncbi:GntR family transcriptional regulator, transcriptional repressor for pyruvate dehydrogenase complex [Streptomyces sp. TLI_053]|uniref:GntR family transcriptional regulator n=1 Tax=Streptomyces sp. TLI_053 TaxID=1855352 RepID=UPI00087CACC0|nr:winged helix-turn-helix domain-containing protein [Streptomyces sp. TLI_053]SDT78324.1 GntR family transcriptional regulator, transcriptional repressor for pyruvate dehydrogenase complex [Streptomyces sp. TLI_053]